MSPLDVSDAEGCKQRNTRPAGGRFSLLLTAVVLPAQNRAPCGQIGGTGWKYASTSF
jgi:hypothetical protein